jgi:hypothetical protein
MSVTQPLEEVTHCSLTSDKEPWVTSPRGHHRSSRDREGARAACPRAGLVHHGGVRGPLRAEPEEGGDR